MTLFCIELQRSDRSNRRKDCMNKEMFASTGRIAFKGQVFSAPLNQEAILQQLLDLEKQEPLVLPVGGAVLAARCRLWISSGLTDLNKLLKQATIRRNVVVEYIRLMKATGHTDFKNVEMDEVKRRARGMVPTDEPTIPPEIVPCDLGDVLEEDANEDFLGTDKAATPAERSFSEANLERSMARTRPQVLLTQRDSDVNKDVQESRSYALEQFGEVALSTGSSLLGQFRSDYPSRVFHTSLPWEAGGPDFGRERNPRRAKDADAPSLPLDTYTCMNASRVEYNIRSDWDLLPALWSLNFASKVNTTVSMSLQRCLKRGAGSMDGLSDRDISLATANIYKILWKGDCEINGQRSRINGDLNKLPHAIGLKEVEKAMLANYQFMSGMLAGTRQVRRNIRNVIFSSLVVYGTPVFLTFTPSERHSGVAIHLYRGRRNDPAYQSAKHDAKEFAEYIGYAEPSLRPRESTGVEHCVVELPEYDVRRLITARDPLCCLQAFQVMARLLYPALFGLRMCPKCPHCIESKYPCIDRFGSNGTPMGGGAGRADASIGAVEAQKAEGVLHLHLFIFLQMANQHATLQEIAELFQQQLLSINAIKAFHSYVRCASLPDPVKMEEERAAIEEAWPAYADDKSLSLLPEDFWDMGKEDRAMHPWQEDFDPTALAAWDADGVRWRQAYEARVQHTFSRMNHHIHPMNDTTGERVVLKSCRPKGTKDNICKSGFPLEKELTPAPLFVCSCVAKDRELPQRGRKSALGSILSARNWSYLNAGPRLLVAVMGDNADMKFTQRYPILKETHEPIGTQATRDACLASRSNKDMLLDMQSGQAMAMGYFGGYAGKEQKIGAKETERIAEAFSRKIAGEDRTPTSVAKKFSDCCRRMVKDIECKGLIRTAVEATNLAEYADHPDTLMAECMRSFNTMIFPAVVLLKREEIETGRTTGVSVIAPLHHNHGNKGRAYAEAPYDLLYGFRGCDYEVDLHSPFEMFRYCSVERIAAPTASALCARSRWTPAGREFKKKELDQGNRKPAYIAGVHFEALEGIGRILLPEYEALRGLRHCWCWEKRERPTVPVFSKCKMPDRRWSPEENSRLLSVYMRPWTLDTANVSKANPLLSNLGRSHVNQEEVQGTNTPISYSSSWDWYISANVVSELSRRYIINLLGSTTARTLDKHADEESDGSDSDVHTDIPEHVGSMALVEKTLNGIYSKSSDDGLVGFGRYATTIRLGRNLWQTVDTPRECKGEIRERMFLKSDFPTGRDIQKAFTKLQKVIVCKYIF